jgi:hypothetical protein
MLVWCEPSPARLTAHNKDRLLLATINGVGESRFGVCPGLHNKEEVAEKLHPIVRAPLQGRKLGEDDRI